jgi:hypothetical protein
MIFQCVVSVPLILTGAAMLFSLAQDFAWATLLGGSLSVLFGVGVLVRVYLTK